MGALKLEEGPAPFSVRPMRTAQLCHGMTVVAHGYADNALDARYELIDAARSLHAALGPWLGERTPIDPTRDPLLDEYAHEVEVFTQERFNGGEPFTQVVAALEDGGVGEVAGRGRTREAALESLRVALVERQASEWAAYARALKGGE